MADLAASMAAAYGASAAVWADGPARAYDRLAEVLVEASPVVLDGALVLDLGAGTGAASRAAQARGACAVALDLAVDMLRYRRHDRPPAVAGDAATLPFRARTFDAVVAGFSISHLPDPVRAFGEAARITRDRGVVLASVFSARYAHPAKAQVEEVAACFGYRRPTWYDRWKREVEPLTAEPEGLAAAARQAGLGDITVIERRVPLDLDTAADQVAWRLGMASMAGFVASLPPARRAELVAAACEAVGQPPEPCTPLVLILSSRVAA
jgi:SAM-dependent methyltransferase